MKSLNTVMLAVGLALICSPVWAGHRHGGHDKAKVIRTSPIYETIRYPVDEQVCWDEQVWRQHHPSAVPTVAGAIIGGVVGNQVFRGDGRAFATVAGATIGGVVGHQVAKNHHRGGAYPVTRTRCAVQRGWRTEQQIVGWDVDYRYRGRIYHTRMPERPGKHIRVSVDVAPALYYPGH
ncbi:glycine zipper 2TM domain-containing protein [Pseudomonadota bacterium]